MSPARPAERTRGLLAAGAILPVRTKVPQDEAVDVLEARAYGHPALGDRPVVRLTPATLAPAEDLTLEFLGFGAPSVTANVGVARRKALGFPGWALINDPENSGYALAVVKEMERLARVAKSKPGHAKDGFEQIADRLQRSVPQFLPSYFEQAGRFFIDTGNSSMAATMFGKARDAERAFSLPVDEDVRRDAFLEFAFAGALTARTLDEYGKRLSDAYAPQAAFDHFRLLAVQRTLGGLPPWTSMVDGLHRLAKAAGLDSRAEDERLIVELLDAPATALAPSGFWKPLRPVLVSLAESSPEARGKLLNLFPKPARGGRDLDGWWLSLLTDSGATRALSAPIGSVPAETEPAGGPAAWLSRMIAHLARGWGHIDWTPLFPLIEMMAPRLRSDGVAVGASQRRLLPPDVVDVALALDIPLEPPSPQSQMDVGRWLAQSPQRRRSLEHLAADPDFGPSVDRGVFSYLFRGQPAAPLLSVPGLRMALVRWLDVRAERLSGGGLPGLRAEIDLIARAVTPGIVALNPGAAERIRAADVAAALARTLRAGIFDEFGWPALEAAESRLGKTITSVSTSWPYLIVADTAKVVAVGPGATELEHDLRLPPMSQRYGSPWFSFTDGQLLVAWSGPGGRSAYWSNQPANVVDFEGAHAGWGPANDIGSLPVASGGRTFGGRALRAGDTKLQVVGRPVSDGDGWWVLQARDDGSVRWRELDPVSGHAGRASLPPFFEVDGELDWELQHRSCQLRPLPDGMGDSPLGSAGGLAGQRVRVRPDGSVECVSVDGRRFTGKLANPRVDWRGHISAIAPDGLLAVPGDDAPRPLRQGRDQMGSTNPAFNQVELWDPTGAYIAVSAVPGSRRPNFARGTPLVPPVAAWDAMQPRDPRGSHALRALSDESARQLLRAAADESDEIKTPTSFVDLKAEDLPRTRAVLGQVAPPISNPDLIAGVVGVLQSAAWLERAMSAAAADVPAAADRPEREEREPDPTDNQLADALAGLSGGAYWYGGGSGGACLEQIRVVSKWVASQPAAAEDAPPATMPGTNVDWLVLVGRIEALAYRAALPTTSHSQRAVLVRLMETWIDTPFVSTSGRFRRVSASREGARFSPPSIARRNGSCYFISASTGGVMPGQRQHFSVLELNDGGRFSPPPEMVAESEKALASRWTPQQLQTFLTTLAEHGPIPWPAEAVERVRAGTGLTRAEATLLVASFPNLDRYQQNFLDKVARELMRLKVAEASAARVTLAKNAVGDRLDLLASAMPDDPRDLWEHAPSSLGERLAGSWIARHGRRAPIPEHLVASAKKFVSRGVSAHQLLATIADPSSVPALNTDAVCFINEKGGLAAYADDFNTVFSERWLIGTTAAAAWLAAILPVGDALRSQAAVVLDLLRQRVSNPDLLVAWTGLAPDQAAALQVDRLPAYRPPKGMAPPGSFDATTVVFVVGQWQTQAFLRPAALARSADDPWVRAISMTEYGYYSTVLGAATFALSDGAAAIVERVRDTPVEPGSYETNPMSSTRELVAEVGAARTLSEQAATLYLQVLALHDASSKSITAWNGWSPAEYKRAATELVGAGLVSQGKRPRAGREIFLPGGWEALAAPDLPLEAWKAPLYGLERRATGALAGPLGRVLPLRPVHEIFGAAWERCTSGDAPGLEAAGPRAGQRKTR